MSLSIRGQGGHLIFRSARKTQTWERTLISCFLSSFLEIRSAVSDEKSKMSQRIRDQGGHLVFPIDPKNTNLVDDVEILFPVKFHWIPFSLSEEKSKMSWPIWGQGGHFAFPIGPKNTNLVLLGHQIFLFCISEKKMHFWRHLIHPCHLITLGHTNVSNPQTILWHNKLSPKQ